MATGRHIQKKGRSNTTPTPASGMFQPRPFAEPVEGPDTATPTELPSSAELTQLGGDRLSRLEVSTSPPIQPKLTIGAVDDPYEQEADTIARKVVKQISTPTPPDSTPPGDQGSVQSQGFSPPSIRRLTQQPQEAIATGEASTELESQINQAKSGGMPLQEPIRHQMEGAFGTDFSAVRVHTQNNADNLNRSLNARAFTTGNHIFFKQGEYHPRSVGGQELLAHELTHVVQQGGTQNKVQHQHLKLSSTPRIQRKGSKPKLGTNESAQETLKERDRSPAEIAEALHTLFLKETGSYSQFNQAIRLMAQPDIQVIAAEYRKLGENTLINDIEICFGGKDNPRFIYLKDLLNHNGKPTNASRIALSLGLMSKSLYWERFIANEDEVIRFAESANPQEWKTLWLKYQKSFNKLSTYGAKRLKMVSESQDYYADLEAYQEEEQGISQRPPEQPASPEEKEALKQKADQVFSAYQVKKLLANKDAQLAYILDQIIKGSGAILGRLSGNYTSIDRGQVEAAVAGWIVSAKAEENKYFNGTPLIRLYVLGKSVEFTPPDGKNPIKIPEKTNTKALRSLYSRGAKSGFNDGDRLYIELLILAGTTQASTVQSPPPTPQPSEEHDWRSASHEQNIQYLEQAIAKTEDTAVAAALASIARELKVTDKTFTANRRAHIVSSLLSLNNTQRIAFINSFLTGEKVDEAEDEKAAIGLYNKVAKKLSQILSTLGVENKDIAQIGGRFIYGSDVSNIYLMLRRHVDKDSFKPQKVVRMVAQLPPGDRQVARRDVYLLKKLQSRLTSSSKEWQTIASLLEVDAKDPAATPDVGEYVSYFAKDQASEDKRKQQAGAIADSQQQSISQQIPYLAQGFSALIEFSDDEKKMLKFALDIWQQGEQYQPTAEELAGTTGKNYTDNKDQFLATIYDQLNAKAKQKFSKKTPLGESLKKGKPIDVINSLITIAYNRLSASDIDTGSAAFEQLSGKTLLEEWTTIKDFEPKLKQRQNKLVELEQELLKLPTEPDASQAEAAEEQQESINQQQEKFENLLEEFVIQDLAVRRSFVPLMREDRRQQLKASFTNKANFLDVVGKFFQHLANSVHNDGGFVQALKDKGARDEDLLTLGPTYQYIAAQEKEKFSAKSIQWTAFTVMGQERQESSSLLLGSSRKLEQGRDRHEDLSDAKEDFSKALAELQSRTSAFEAKAAEFRARIKQVIGLLLAIAITVATAGIGSLATLPALAIQAGIAFAKEVVIAAVDTALDPRQQWTTNFLGTVGIAAFKTVASTALNYGLQEFQTVLETTVFKLKDAASGLDTGEAYIVLKADGTQVVKNAFDPYQGSTALREVAKYHTDLFVGASQKLGDRVINLITDSIQEKPSQAWTKFKQSFTATDLLNTYLSPVYSRLTEEITTRIQDEALKNVSDQQQEIDGKKVFTEKLENGESSLKQVLDREANYGDKVASGLYGIAESEVSSRTLGQPQELTEEKLAESEENRKSKAQIVAVNDEEVNKEEENN